MKKKTKKNLAAFKKLVTDMDYEKLFNDVQWPQDCPGIFQEVAQDSETQTPVEESILEEAERLTSQDRNEQYGSWESNALVALDFYKNFKGCPVEELKVSNPADFAMLMACLKQARESHYHKRDNVVDCVGYWKLYYEMKEIYPE